MEEPHALSAQPVDRTALHNLLEPTGRDAPQCTVIPNLNVNAVREKLASGFGQIGAKVVDDRIASRLA